MAESVILVCDVCGKPAEEGVIIRVGGRNLAKDLCGTHLRELLAGAHAPKRGRRPGSTSRSTVKPSTRAKRRTRKSAAETRRASVTGRKQSRRSRGKQAA